MGFLHNSHIFSLIFSFPCGLHTVKSFPEAVLFACPQQIPSEVVSEYLVNSLLMGQQSQEEISFSGMAVGNILQHCPEMPQLSSLGTGDALYSSSAQRPAGKPKVFVWNEHYVPSFQDLTCLNDYQHSLLSIRNMCFYSTQKEFSN